MDFAAVVKKLDPIQETLNESADMAMYPSPPINTPEILSPAPSIVHRAPASRARGFSIIDDRFAELKMTNTLQREADAISSNRSMEPSVAGEQDHDATSILELPSKEGKSKLTPGANNLSAAPSTATVGDSEVPIALGSPTVNPRIVEYLSFSSKDLPTKGSRNSLKSDGGVTEKSNWAEELEESVDRACMRLEQLAKDENTTNPSMSVDEYYIARLQRLLGSGKRVVPVKIEKVEAE